MIAIGYYLFKVMLCSGVLFLYYHLALRNKAFHQWNRFFLLAAVVISLIIPALKFTVDNIDESSLIFPSAQAADNYIIQIQKEQSFSLSVEQWIGFGYMAAVSILLMAFIRSLQKIRTIIKAHVVRKLDDIKFIDTEVQGTPFSFFQYIFWNKNIDLKSKTGQQIFQHELVHVKEKHSIDKLFIQIVLILFWLNPFFWLIRRELQLIHEFIADKKAVEQHGTAAFAAMILQSVHPKQFGQIINPFFQSSIKRRLTMLTKIQNPRWNYLSRISVLPVAAILVIAFSCRMEKSDPAPSHQASESSTVTDQDSEAFYVEEIYSDTVPKQTYKGKQVTSTKVFPARDKVHILFFDGTKDSLSISEAIKQGLKLPPPPPPPLKNGLPTKAQWMKASSPNAIYYLNGMPASRTEIEKLNVEMIQSVKVLNSEVAIKKYGQNGKNGVIEITTKSLELEDIESLTEVEVDSISYTREKGYQVNLNNAVFKKVEIEASVNRAEWRKFLESRLQTFIENAAAKGMKPGQYTVQVRFIVELDGSITSIETLTNHGYGLEEV